MTIQISPETTVAVVGLGYVGLPLAVEFGKRFRTIGYDMSASKVNSYKQFRDPANELSSEMLRAAIHLECTTDASRLSSADYIIVAVPTPVTQANIPDLDPLVSSSMMVGKHMKKGVIVIYESTVYPGATEEVCIPVLEQNSSMQWGKDFHVGYSPERINPGDKKNTLTNITKIVSGDGAMTLDKVASLYGCIIAAGVHRASSIKVAEAAKVIENTQRDLNISLMNELAIIFDKIGIDTTEVLEAAGTKWNFLKFKPGLVGGHCISVDPYYLTYKAETLGYHPQVILAGRRINDGMGKYIAEQTVKMMIKSGCPIKASKVNVLGVTFKENCPDTRNSKVVDLISELESFGIDTAVYDPLADPEEVLRDHGIKLCKWNDLVEADAIVLAVSHQTFCDMPKDRLLEKIRTGGVLIDVKSCLPRDFLQESGLNFWRL